MLLIFKIEYISEYVFGLIDKFHIFSFNSEEILLYEIKYDRQNNELLRILFIQFVYRVGINYKSKRIERYIEIGVEICLDK